MRPGYLAHPVDFKNLDSTMKTSFHTDVMKEDLDIEGHEVVKDVSTDGGSSTEEAVSVTKTKFLFHLRSI